MATSSEAQEATAQIRAVLGARQLILDGELKPGDRISELMLVDRLGVSRTPVRMALVRLHEEGFIDTIPSGGFEVRSFSEREVFDAIELRGMLEGFAARHAAERGIPAPILRRMRSCLQQIDDYLGEAAAGSDVTPYVRLNDEFHALIWEAPQSDMAQRMLDRLVRLPFASPSAFTLARSELPLLRPLLSYSQTQHHIILEAMEGGDGWRAELMAREHSRSAAKYLREVLQAREENPQAGTPPLSLVRNAGRR